MVSGATSCFRAPSGQTHATSDYRVDSSGVGMLQFSFGSMRSNHRFATSLWRRAASSESVQSILSGPLRDQWYLPAASGECLVGRTVAVEPFRGWRRAVRFSVANHQEDFCFEHVVERGRYSSIGFIATAVDVNLVQRLRGDPREVPWSNDQTCDWVLVVVERNSRHVRLEAVSTIAREECGEFPVPIIYFDQEACVEAVQRSHIRAGDRAE